MAIPSKSLERARPDTLPGIEPDRTITDWGRSERLTALLDGTLVEFLYRYWFRVEVEGLEHVPATGGALLVANRAGSLPLDAAVIARAARDGHPRPRPVQFAAADTHAATPGLGMLITKLGAISAHPANLHRLLFDEQELVLAFPESGGAAAKPLRARYRLGPFDALAFVDCALRARAPIVPVAVLGGEEALPSLGTLRALGPLARRLPLAAAVPLPAKFRVRFLEPLPAAALATGAPAELAGEIRRLIQENLLELVAQRRSVWLG